MENMDNVIIGENISLLTAMRILKIDEHWGPTEFIEKIQAQPKNGYPYQTIKELEIYGVDVWMWEQCHFHLYNIQVNGEDIKLTLVKIWNDSVEQIISGNTILGIVTLNNEQMKGQIDCIYAKGLIKYEKKQILALILPAS